MQLCGARTAQQLQITIRLGVQIALGAQCIFSVLAVALNWVCPWVCQWVQKLSKNEPYK